jgi:AGZA family xanthine/uracil permease-like MFS transporter
MTSLRKLLGATPETSLYTETIAGLTTFFAMSYILVVNPMILSATGMDKGALFTATALAACLGTFAMAFIAKIPFALAPGMGLNAFFAYTICLGMGYSWHFALTAVFLEGIIFVILTLTNLRSALIRVIPDSLKIAFGPAIGIFIAFLGLQNAGIVVKNDATLVSIGSVTDPHTLLSLVGLVILGILYAKKVMGAMLIGIAITTFIGVPLGVTHFDGFFSLPPSIAPVFLQFDFSQALSFDMLLVVFTLLYIDVFDTLGTLVGVAERTGFMNPDGSLKRSKQAFLADSLATTFGACLGTSTTTTYMESATGVAEGGRTGWTPFVVGICFLLSLFYFPLLSSIPAAAVAPALVIAGLFLIEPICKLNFDDMSESLPAFICILAMPLTYSISEGISLSVVAFVAINLVLGKTEKIHPFLYVLAALFVLRYAVI